MSINNIVIVLVETSDPGNIGASARAMKTMGLTSLRLVNPVFFPHPKAIWRATNASDVVEEAQVFTSLEEAVADCQLTFAASARNRSLPWPQIEAHDAGIIINKARTKQKVALVFGREKSGLSNCELQQCMYHISIVANPSYGVLNLSHAVQILAYEVYRQYLGAPKNIDTQSLQNTFSIPWDKPLANHKELTAMMDTFEQMLITTGFYNPKNPQLLMPRLHRFFRRSGMDAMEVNIWRGILSHILISCKQKNNHETDN